METRKIFGILILSVGLTINCFAQKPGATIVRIDDGVTTRCINRNSDAVQIGFAGMKIDKKKNWFQQQTQAGIQVGVRVEGMDAEYNTKATEFTQIYVVDVKEYDKGSILLPIEGNIVRYFPLQNKGTFYNGIDLAVTLIQKKDNTSFGVVVKELASMTKQFPFPTTPFDPGIKMLADFTSKIISPSNDEDNKINRIPASTINLPFSPNGNCNENSFQEKTGVFSVVFGSENVDAEGYVDINKTSDYLFKLQTSPSRAILVCKKDAQGKCTNFKPLNNDFLLFYINAFPLNPTSPKTTLTVTPNTETKVNSDSIKISLKNSEWFQMANMDFQTKIMLANSELEKTNKLGTFKYDKNKILITTELFNSGALIFDYLEASRRLINLGLSEEVNDLPQLPKYMLQK
jgi:hypothetical protein